MLSRPFADRLPCAGGLGRKDELGTIREHPASGGRNREENKRGLPLIVPLVLYQGAEPWPYDREFAELFTRVVQEWR